MATYIVDSTGNNNAEILGDFTTDDVAQTVTFNAGTDGEAKPLKALETTRQWLVIEVREVGGVAGVIGKHVYSEDVTDIQTRVEAIRQEMIALHSTFIITCTHYKTGNTCDVYRGDEATVVALSVDDTSIAFTPPAVWTIYDLTPFAPTTPVADANMVIDPTCDSSSDWTVMTGSVAITGGKLEITEGGTASRIRAHLNTPLESGVTYTIGCDVDAKDTGGYRFYCGNASSGYLYGTGFNSANITWDGTDTDIGIQALTGVGMTCDNFTCTRVV